MTLWTAEEIASATGGDARAAFTASGVSIDTRTLQKGDLFVALQAARDGHDFVAAALAAGAAGALVSRVPDGLADDAPLVVVDDVQAGLEALGRAGRARTGARVVAITGSVGKTSTKEMLACILGDQGRCHASVASYNNHWGVPLTLARMPADSEFAVIEIGMNHPGEIAPLARQARPHVALITTVAAAHLEAFESVDAIAHEKAAILDGLEPDGLAILPRDIETAPILFEKAQKSLSFGSQEADYQMKSAEVHGNATVVEATANGAPLLFKLNTIGTHFAMNALGALAAAEALGADPALAVHSLGRWKPYAGRGVRERIILDAVETDLSLDLIDDAYNANPTSMAASLAVLAATIPRDDTGRVSRGRRIAILGDMKELGPEAEPLHAGLADLASMESVTVVHCIGPLMQSLHKALPAEKRGLWVETAEELAPKIKSRLDSGDVVLAKGSLSMKIGLIVDAIRKMGQARAEDTQDDE